MARPARAPPPLREAGHRRVVQRHLDVDAPDLPACLAEADATAYVGVPLPHTGGAAVLGTLAVVHDEPLEIDGLDKPGGPDDVDKAQAPEDIDQP